MQWGIGYYICIFLIFFIYMFLKTHVFYNNITFMGKGLLIQISLNIAEISDVL